MKIYVTGAAGMIGSNVCAALLKDNYSVIGIDNLYRGKKENLHPLLDNKSFKFLYSDISSDVSWAAEMQDSDVVIHLADIVAGIGFVFSQEWSIYNKNVAINSNVANVVSLMKPKQLIYVGTACSYPRSKQLSVELSELSEHDKFPAHPESGYGWGKLVGDIEYKYLCADRGIKYTCLDLHNVYGTPCDFNPKTAQVLPSLVYKGLTQDLISAWGDGSQGRAFVHVDDVVRAIILSLKNETNDNFMIGPNKCTTIREAVEIILANPLIRAKSVIWDKTKPVGDIGRYSNGDHASTVLGWKPEVDFKTGINNLIEWISESLH